MSHRVTVLPDGQSFAAEAGESLLDGAIRAGIALDYGCENGNCGRCRARLVKGELHALRSADYPLSAAGKARGDMLMCVQAAKSDVVIEAQVARRAQDIEVQQIRGRIRAIQRLTPEVAVLKLRTSRSQRLRFLAGQYATLMGSGLPPYETSIASCPCDGLNLEFHVRHLAGEPFSEAVFSTLKAGDSLDLAAPQGDFGFDDSFHGPLLFVAFDTGFAAIKSLLEHATAQNEERAIFLYWIACGKGGQYLENLCRSWADALDAFHYRALSVDGDFASLSRDPGAAQRVAAGFFESIAREMQELKLEGQSALSQVAGYVSAPEPLLESARGIFGAAGLAEACLRLEPVRGNRNVSCLLPQKQPGIPGG